MERHLTIADLKQAANSPAYSPEVYILLRGKETENTVGVYRAESILPIIARESGDVAKGSMLIVAHDEDVRKTSEGAETQSSAIRQEEPRTHPGGIFRYIRGLFR